MIVSCIFLFRHGCILPGVKQYIENYNGRARRKHYDGGMASFQPEQILRPGMKVEAAINVVMLNAENQNGVRMGSSIPLS
jgi:hypothetical protein